MIERERQQALAIVNDHVRAENRIGGAKPNVVNAVMWALERGLDEKTVLRVIAIWQKWCCYPGPYRKDLSTLLDETTEAIARVAGEAGEGIGE